MPYYNVCPYCGAHLDPGERCTCREERSAAAIVPDKLEAVKIRGTKKEQLVQTFKFKF